MKTFKDRDVVRYTPSDVWPGNNRHCREGMAIAAERTTGTPLFDTFWSSSGDRHLLTFDELQTAEVVFNLDDFDPLPPAQAYTWETYHPDHRQVVTHQHGLQRDLYIRKGAKPDLGTKVENAARAVLEAEEEVRAAEQRLQWRTAELQRLHDEAVTA